MLLDRGVVRVLSIHADVLLSSGVHPGGSPGVVVHEVGPTFRRMPLLPQLRELPTSCGCRTSSHGYSACGSFGIVLLTRWLRGARGTRSRTILWQHSVLMALTLQLRVCFICVPLILCVVRCRRTNPGRGSSIVIDVVSPPEDILATFPSSGKSSVSILKRTVISRSTGL